MTEQLNSATLRLTEHEALVNLRVVLQLCAAGKLRCSEKTQRPSEATTKVITEAVGDFYDEETISAFAWPLLLQAGGLAELAKGRLRLTAKGRCALTTPSADTIRLLWNRWLTHGAIDEFSRIEFIKGQRVANVLTAAKPRRQAIGTALATCPPDRWLTVDALFGIVRSTGFSVTRNEQAQWKLYLVDPEYGSLGYSRRNEWEVVEGRYALAVVFEYAATLGLFDLEYVDPVDARDDFRDIWGSDEYDYLSRYDGLRLVRLNALGAYVFGLRSDYQAPAAIEASRILKVLPNFDIVVTGNLSPIDQLTLDAYAKRTSDHVWALSAATLLAAVDGGRELDEFAQFLESRTQVDLPATIGTLFEDVRHRASQLRDAGLVRLIACDDRAVIALIARDRKLRTLCEQVGDHHLAVRVSQETAFRTALRKLGYVLPVQ